MDCSLPGLKRRDITLPTKVLYSQSYGFSSSHVWMWELNHKEGWGLKNWCFRIVVLDKNLEFLGQQGDQPWIFIGRTDAETEAPILWPLDMKSWLIRKDPDAGKDWGQEEKGMTEDEMIRCHRHLDGHDFEQAPRVGDGQGSLTCCSPWGRSDWVTELKERWLSTVSLIIL